MRRDDGHPSHEDLTCGTCLRPWSGDQAVSRGIARAKVSLVGFGLQVCQMRAKNFTKSRHHKNWTAAVIEVTDRDRSTVHS